MNRPTVTNVLPRNPRARRRAAGFTVAEIMIALAIIAVLAGLGTMWFLPPRRIQEDRMALTAITSIYAAKQAYLELHPGTDPNSTPTEAQLAPLLAIGGKRTITAREENNDTKGGTGSGGNDKLGTSYPLLNGLLPSRYRVVSIGAFNVNPTLSPAPPDPIAAPPLVLGTSTPIVGGPIVGTPIEEPVGDQPVGIELPVGPVTPKDQPPKGE